MYIICSVHVGAKIPPYWRQVQQPGPIGHPKRPKLLNPLAWTLIANLELLPRKKSVTCGIPATDCYCSLDTTSHASAELAANFHTQTLPSRTVHIASAYADALANADALAFADAPKDGSSPSSLPAEGSAAWMKALQAGHRVPRGSEQVIAQLTAAALVDYVA